MKKVLWGYSSREVDSTLETLSNQNAALIQHNDYMEDELKNLTVQLDEARASIAAGMTKADADGYKELKFAYAALQDRVKNHDEELEKIQNQVDEAKAEALKAIHEAEQAKQEALTAKAERDSAREEIERAKKLAEDATVEMKTAQEESNRMKAESLEIKAERDEMLEQLEKVKLDAANEVNAAREESERVKAETLEIKAERDEVLEELERVRNEAANDAEIAREEIERAKAEVLEIRTERDVVCEELQKSMVDASLASTEDLESAKTEANLMREKLESALAEANEAREEASSLRLLIDRVREEAESAKTRLEEANAEVEVARGYIEETKQQMNEAVAEKERLQAELFIERSTSTNSKEQLELKLSEIQETSQKNAELERQCEILRNRINEMQDKLSRDTGTVSVELAATLDRMLQEIKTTKEESRQKMLSVVDDFASQWKYANVSLDERLSEIDKIRAQSEEDFRNAIGQMMVCYRRLENRTNAMHDIMSGLEERRSELEIDLRSSVNKLGTSASIKNGELEKENSVERIAEEIINQAISKAEQEEHVANKTVSFLDRKLQ